MYLKTKNQIFEEKIVRTISVKGRKYKVYLKEKLLSDDGRPLWGSCNNKFKTIDIREDKESIECTLQTIVHELFHAYLYECGNEDGSCDESAVTWFEINFLQILNSFLEIAGYVYVGNKNDFSLIQKTLKKVLGGKLNDNK